MREKGLAYPKKPEGYLCLSKLGEPDISFSTLYERNGRLTPLKGGPFPRLGRPDNSNSPLSQKNGKLTPLEDGNYPSVEGDAGLKSPMAKSFPYPQIESKYDKYEGRLAPMENFPMVRSQDDRNYPTDGGQHGFNSEVPGGGNYPLLGSQDGQIGNELMPRRQSGRDGMPDELVNRNRLW